MCLGLPREPLLLPVLHTSLPPSDNDNPLFEERLPHMILYPRGQVTASRLGTGILTGSPQQPGSLCPKLLSCELCLLRCLVCWLSLPPKPEIGQASHGPRRHPRTYPKSTFHPMFKLDSVAYTPKTLAEKMLASDRGLHRSVGPTPWLCSAHRPLGISLLPNQSFGGPFMDSRSPGWED